MQSGTGIQELMAAETRASQIVAEARIGKLDSLGIDFLPLRKLAGVVIASSF